MNERWEDIEGTGGRYRVSDHGRVWSNVSNRLLRPTINAIGYEVVGLGRGTIATVHRLVAAAFLDADHSRPWVNHINGVKTDNRAVNLEWCTPGENNSHAIKAGLRTMPSGAAHFRTSINEKQARVIMRCALLGLPHRFIAEQFGIGQRTVCSISLRRTWSSVTSDIH